MNKIIAVSVTSVFLSILACALIVSNFRDSSSSGFVQLQRFNTWKNQESIQFASAEEENYRLQIFMKNLIKVENHNKNQLKQYELTLNQFAHLSEIQFAQLYTGAANAKKKKSHHKSLKVEISWEMPIKEMDWQFLGKVSQIKNQGACDASYAFSATSLVQSNILMQNKNIVLSEQQIIDCSGEYETLGCGGGSLKGSLEYIKDKGLATSQDYPFAEKKNDYCRYGQSPIYKVNFTLTESNGCDQLKDNLYKSPIIVAVNARTWQLYKTGIFSGCSSVQANHDTFLVGINSNYWRLKNSWGLKWGEYGYIRLKIGNTCGICDKTGFGYIL